MASMTQTQQLAEEMLTEHGLSWEGWRFEFDRAKSRGGVCNYTRKVISLSRNLVPLWTEEQVLSTLVHEICHALVGPGHGHDHVWGYKMRELGFEPDRTHSFATVEKRWVGYCDHCGIQCGSRHRLTQVMRDRGIHAQCRTRIRWVDTTKEKGVE